MNRPTRNKPIPLDLECGHRLWFLRVHMPRKYESVWCRSCDAYVKRMEDAANEGRTLWPEGYSTTPTAGGFLVHCERGCDATWKARSIADADQTAYRHIVIEHGMSSLVAPALTMKPKLTEPDF